MSDWEFLYDMQDEGYSPEQIEEAAACGYNLYEIDISDLEYSDEEWLPLEKVNLTVEPSKVNPELKAIFERLVETAKSYHTLTGRYLQIWGELGELYAEIEYGIKRHKPNAKGSDGKIGNDFIEVKTISPEKSIDKVRVKRTGNFNKLLIVKISKDFTFEGKLKARKTLAKGEGTHASASWKNEGKK